MRHRKDWLRQLGRLIVAPFSYILRKLKKKARKFVLRTVHKEWQGVSAAAPGSRGDHSAEDLMLAMLKAGTRPRAAERPALQAIPMGDGRLLALHPVAGFTYVGTHDVQLAPAVALGCYQERETAVLEREVASGDRVLHLAAQQGFHTLTIAQRVEASGRVVAVEVSGASREILELNIRAHELSERVHLPPRALRARGALRECLCELAFEPTLVYLTDGADFPDEWIDDVLELVGERGDIRVFCGDRELTLDLLGTALRGRPAPRRHAPRFTRRAA